MRRRFIPVLLIDSRRRLVKTVQFGARTYLGDPFNVIRIFNEREVDEICVLDIDASESGREPDVGYIAELASECFMPLAYGGGITNRRVCEQIVRSGVEKLVLGRRCFDEALVTDLSGEFGAQAIVGCIDVKRSIGGYTCEAPAGFHRYSISPIDLGRRLEEAGVGEVLLQSVDRDGTRQGYDEALLREVCPKLSIPVIALGGAGSVEHLSAALECGASAAASGSAFVFLGRLRAVLITYPDRAVVEPQLIAEQ
jgi:cyclase